MSRVVRTLLALALLLGVLAADVSATASSATISASAIAGDRSARVSWTITLASPPSSVLLVEVRLQNQATVLCSGGPSETSCDVPGLTNGTPVQFTVTATFTDMTTATTTTTTVTPAPIMLDNGRFRFGGGREGSSDLPTPGSSINSSGNLLQPFYWNPAVPRWEKLTFSSLPLDVAVGTGTGGSNWTGATIVENPPLASQTIIPLTFNCVDPAVRSGTGGAYASAPSCPTNGSTAIGWGRVESSGIAVINGQALRITSTYELTADSQFVKVTTSLENASPSAAPNVNLWVGTRDDYVGFVNFGHSNRADRPLKEKGNLSGSNFALISNKANPSSALRITSSDGTVLFFSSTPNTNMSVSSCCSFSNAYNTNPVDTGITDGPRDGSYALHLPLGDLAPAGSFGSSQQLIWFYAGGPIGDATSLASSVSAAAPPAAPVATPGNGRVRLDWVTPTNVSAPTGFRVRMTDVSTGAVTVNDVTDGAAQSTTILNLVNDTLYRFEVAALTGSPGVPGPFSSASQAIPGRPIGVLPTITHAGLAPLPEDVLTGDAREADWRWLEGDGDLTTVLQWEQDGANINGATATMYTIPAGTAPSGFRLVVTRTSALSGLSASVASATVALGDLRPIQLTLSAGELEPGFDRDSTSYTVEVPNATTSLGVRPTLQPPTTARVNGSSVSSGTLSSSIPLIVGETTITLRTEIGASTRDITITVTRLATTPSAPSAVTATAGPASATVTWTAGSDGGSAITGASLQYSTDNGSTWIDATIGACAPISDACRTVSGLSPGTEYVFRVRLQNAIGAGPYSGASATGVTPTAPPVAPTEVAPPAPLPPGPVLTAGAPPRPSPTPTARIGDREVTVVPTPAGTTRQVGTTTVSTATILEIGGVSLAVDVTGAGEVRTPASSPPQVSVVRDRVARTSGGGLLPGTQVQAWLPLSGGTTIRPVTTIPVAADGTFTGELPFDGRTDRQSDGRPLPIGTHVLQLVGVDAAGEITVIEQTVRIEQPDPSPEPDRRAGAPPTLRPGASIATNAGVPEAVTIVPVPEVRQARVEGTGWTMAVDIPSAEGRVAPAEGGGALIELVEEDFAEVSGDGFLPGTRADVWLFSTPTLLGTVTIGPDGSFAGLVPVTGIATGEHTLQLQGVGRDGYVRAANLGVAVVPRANEEPAPQPEPEPEATPEPAPERPADSVEVITATGPEPSGGSPLVWIALLAAVLGSSGWWFLVGRRRRDDEEAEAAHQG